MRRFHLQQIDSTNLEAMRRWNASPADQSPLVVRADVQTAGVGRQDRAWHSPAGGLWFSIARAPGRPPQHYQALPLVIGAFVGRVLEERFGLRTRIKWPNDVLVENRKIAGVLCSLGVGAPASPLVVGVGVNANFNAPLLGGDLRQPATTIQDELSGRDVSLDDLFDCVAGAIAVELDSFERSGIGPFLSDIRRRLVWVGDRVRLTGPSGDWLALGRMAGIDDQGRLMIEDPQGPQAFADGELSRVA